MDQDNLSEAYRALRQKAKEEKWEDVDRDLTDKNITRADYNWASGDGLKEADKNIRDFAATTLMITKLQFEPRVVEILKAVMKSDPYNIVRFRVAMALFGHGFWHTEVVAVLNEAKDNPDVGQKAREFLKQYNDAPL